MGAPDVTISIEPQEGGSVVFGSLAPKSSNDAPNGQLSLVVSITNNEDEAIHLNHVKISLLGPPAAGPAEVAADVTVDPTKTGKWFDKSATVLLPDPAPGAVRAELTFDGYSDPVTAEMPLSAYVSPAAGGGYPFPAKFEDLESGEYWSGRSAKHGAAGGGTQLFAYDLLVRGYDETEGGWTTRLPGHDETLNDSYRAWRTPIYAMADGVVVQLQDGMATNTPPHFPDPPPTLVEGNHFYIQHGADLALYAHFVAGTLNPDLTSGPNPDGSGAQVTKGQLLGLAGNSGRSSEPHLHIQVNRTTKPWKGPPRPLPFKGVQVLDLEVVDPDVWPPNTDSPWSAVSAQCLPSVLSAIWPGDLVPGTAWLRKWLQGLAWAWVIIIGGLMITPGGIECIVCGPLLSRVLGLVSIVMGIAGISSLVRARRASRQRSDRKRHTVEGGDLDA